MNVIYLNVHQAYLDRYEGHSYIDQDYKIRIHYHPMIQSDMSLHLHYKDVYRHITDNRDHLLKNVY